MLELSGISKRYVTGDLVQQALDGLSLSFRSNEFVAILGPSGSGKTTLLNIIGGLDRYDEGDLIINGTSTKKYRDKDWDSYRNHTIGFVFQSYNLIPHQSVLANVELALTISGVSRAERRKRAKEALVAVGLGNQIHKRPNQMSGGQMQRVAIARALVNDPDILLADEPTGALDSETSVQVMELLRNVAKDRLVIMVTHNAELADEYATRTVRLKDGRIVGDTAPFDPSSDKATSETRAAKQGKVSMSFLTALSLSLNNLRTKKGRTILTAFAGSIGIIGIAMILALSTGIHNYVSDIQRSTLASYPVVLEREPNDMLKTFIQMRENDDLSEERSDDSVYSDPRIYRMFNAAFTGSEEKNNIAAFKKYFDDKLSADSSELSPLVSAVQYGYDAQLNVFFEDKDGVYRNTDLSKALFGGDEQSDSTSSNMFNMVSSRMNRMNLWTELVGGRNGEPVSELISDQYELVAGEWPKTANEVVLILDENNSITDTAFYALGYISETELRDMLTSIFKGEAIEETERSAPFSEILGRSFKLIHNSDQYRKSAAIGTWEYIGDDENAMEMVIKNGLDLKLVGIIKPSESGSMQLSGAFGYTHLLTEYLIERAEKSELINDQKSAENANLDLLTGLPFIVNEESRLDDNQKSEKIKEYFLGLNDAEKVEAYTNILALPNEQELVMTVDGYLEAYNDRDAMVELASSTFGFSKAEMSEYLSEYSDEELKEMMREQLSNAITEQYKKNAELQISQLVAQSSVPGDIFGASGYHAVAEMFTQQITGESDVEKLALYYEKFMPASVSSSTLAERLNEFGAIDFDDPATISIYASSFDDKEAITKAISDYNDGVENEEDRIEYTDYVALLMSGVTTMIDAVSYGLIAFVAISLVVSSIMIGIITYISVLERTKEIGILRSIGASKRDVSSVFNAETLIIGLFAGLIGIGVTVLLCIPLNLVLQKLTGIEYLKAVLPLKAGIVLVIISMVLTLISGLIPAGVAARKDPVTALRTE